MLDFCNEINQGREPRNRIQGFYYLRSGDEEKPVVGLPSVPQSWRGHVLAKPLKGSVIAVDSKGIAKISLGRRDGIKPGMVFITMPADGRCAYLQVVSVEEGSAKAKLDGVFSEGKAKVGDKVSTRFSD